MLNLFRKFIKNNDNENNKIINVLGNEDNYIVNLQPLILKSIICQLNNNLDRIAFTLVCKKWYEERDHICILDFSSNITVLDKYNDYTFSNYLNLLKMKTYKKVFERSLELTSDVRYNLYESITDEEIENLNVPHFISTINITTDDEEPLSERYQKLLKRHPNITHLQLKTIRRSEIKSFCIPKQIKIFTLVNGLVTAGIGKGEAYPLSRFHHGIEHITIDTKCNEKQIEPINSDAFPTTLKSLNYTGLNFHISTLPPYLEILNLNMVKSIGFNGFPNTLTTIRINSSWVSKLKDLHLSNWTKLYLNAEESCQIIPGDIPETISLLQFPLKLGSNHHYIVGPGVIPSSCRHLDMGDASFTLDIGQGSQPFFHSESEFDYLRFGLGLKDTIFKGNRILPKTVKELIIDNKVPIHYDTANGFTMPKGLIKLTVGLLTQESPEDFIPNSVRFVTILNLYFRPGGKYLFSVPNTVESLRFTGYVSPNFPIPPSVTSLYGTVDGTSYHGNFKKYIDENLPKTVIYVYINDTICIRRLDTFWVVSDISIPVEHLTSKKFNMYFAKSMIKI